MKPLTVAQAASFCGGTVVGDGAAVFTGVSTDSRSIPEGALFLALCGERFDGHQFIGKAIENGAVAVVSAQDIDVTVPVIRV